MKNSFNSVLTGKGKSLAQRNLWFGIILDSILLLCAIALITLLVM